MSDAKDRLIRIMGTFDLATGHADTMDQVLDALEEELSDVLGHLRVKREWVGLTEVEIRYALREWAETNQTCREMMYAIEAKLKEKNT